MNLIAEMDYDEGRVKLFLPKYLEKVITTYDANNNLVSVHNLLGVAPNGTCEIIKDYISNIIISASYEIINDQIKLFSEVNNNILNNGESRIRLPVAGEFKVARAWGQKDIEIITPEEEPDIEEEIISQEDKEEEITDIEVEVIKDIILGIVSPEQVVYDYTVEQGETYEYYLIDINETSRVSNNVSITTDFEDIFLTDCSYVNNEPIIRQLKIRYNPKVQSFKTVIQETKTDTIGGKYPFFFRNGNVRYKEIPLSGLLETGIDEQGLFAAASKNIEPARGTTAARTETKKENSIANERRFKLEVERWLTNGKPKLFRSPQEGNYIIRLMNVSLSPNDTLARKLHTFSSTGYEVADPTEREYNKLNLYTKEFTAKNDLPLRTATMTLTNVANILQPITLTANDDDIVCFNSVTYQATEDNTYVYAPWLPAKIQKLEKGQIFGPYNYNEATEIKVGIFQGAGQITIQYQFI